MKKPKFLFKINENNTAKVYVNRKWQKYATECLVIAKPQDITVNITKYKVNKQGLVDVVNDAIPSETKTYHFGKNG